MRFWARQALIFYTFILLVLPLIALVGMLVFLSIAFAVAHQITTIPVWKLRRLKRRVDRRDPLEQLMAEYRTSGQGLTDQHPQPPPTADQKPTKRDTLNQPQPPLLQFKKQPNQP